VSSYSLRSFTYLAKSDLVNARADYEKGLSIDPSVPSPFVVRAFWLRTNGNFDGALADYENAIQWKPDYAEAYVDRGVLLGLMGNIEACIEGFKKGTALKSDVLSAGDWHGVGSSPFLDLNAFVKSHPTNARGYEMRGLFKLFQHLDDEAAQD